MTTEEEKAVPEEATEDDGEQDNRLATEEDGSEDEEVRLSKRQKREIEDLIGSCRELREKERREKEELGSSPVDGLREMEENYGMRFSESVIHDSVFVLYPGSGKKGRKKHGTNILGTMDDRRLLEWSSEHYRDYIFAVFLSVCILDCQVYEDILQMGNELQDILEKGKNTEVTEEDNWNYKSRIRETLGVIEYRDRIYVRGTEQEADFLRLPTHKQSGYYLRLFIREFPGLKLALGPYLVSKIFDTCKNRRNYLIVGGCIEALANIGNEDVSYFNAQMLPLFTGKRTVEADYCLAMLLKQMYLMEQNMEYVIACAEQWGRITNNPHYPMTVLYLCGMLKNQEGFVRGVWDVLLNTLQKEIMNGVIFEKNSYYRNLLEFFRSGNGELGYCKGVIHAFYNRIKRMEKEHRRTERDLLGTLFLLMLLNDYEDCDLSGRIKRRQGMLWVEIMEQMDPRTGKELVFLWKQVLQHRQHPGEGWQILQSYLDKYEVWDEKDLERLAFFFYWVNKETGDNRAYSFLKKCALKGRGKLLIAQKIYERIMKETGHGR